VPSTTVEAARGEGADVVLGRAGVAQRPLGGLDVKLVGRAVVDPDDVAPRGPDDGDAMRSRHGRRC
jgi:hypothetical protein